MVWFAKTVGTDSEKQLQNDFGEYPPKPLNVQPNSIPFKIVYLNRLSIFFLTLRQFLKAAFGNTKNIKNKELINHRAKVKKEKEEFVDEIKGELINFKLTLENNLNNKSSFIKVAVISITTLLLIVIAPFALVYIVIKLTAVIYRKLLSLFPRGAYDKYAGFYIYGLGVDSEININTRVVRRNSISVAAVISHEHLHLLQHKEGLMYDHKANNDEHLKRVDALIKNTTNNHLVYLFERVECEV